MGLGLDLAIREGQYSGLAQRQFHWDLRRSIVVNYRSLVGCGGICGYPFTRGAHGESGGWKLHVERLRRFQGSEFLKFLLQPPILFCQGLTASLQILTIHFCLLQLCPENHISKSNTMHNNIEKNVINILLIHSLEHTLSYDR